VLRGCPCPGSRVGRPWEKSALAFSQAGTFPSHENLRFSRVLRTRHVIPDVRRLNHKNREGLPVSREPA